MKPALRKCGLGSPVVGIRSTAVPDSLLLIGENLHWSTPVRAELTLDVLTELEQRAWRAIMLESSIARSFYETVLDDQIVVLLADQPPIQEREAALAALCGEKWEACRLDGLNAKRLSPMVGFASYGIVAIRCGAPYSARACSIYVRRDDGWKLRFHQRARR
ncbi:hypothetical protein [Amycolatopsis sp. NPDC052450]|uniref:hypothetical protein n=1 Tax=Amycolatopsis sp. NPDC052450 TaxID=3363937 RepID=UPI0037C8D062